MAILPEIEILYADREVIAVRKPVGILSESSANRDGLPDLLAGKLRDMGQPTDLYPIHRLDKGVGGVLLLARAKSAAGALSADVAAHKVEKEYRAVIHDRPPEGAGEFFDLLFHDRTKNRSYVVNRMRRGVKDARLEYRVLSSADTEDGSLTLVSVILGTGRTHQIRVQFSSRQLPLWGDDRYGRREKGDIALYCRRIAFTHPKTGKRTEIVAPCPDAFPWTLFDANFEK